MEILKSNYATKEDVVLSRGRKAKIRQFQQAYRELIYRASLVSGKSAKVILREISARSALINRYERVTGDSIIHVAKQVMNSRKHLKSDELQQIINDFITRQVLWPEYFKHTSLPRTKLHNRKAKKAFESMLKIVKDCREGI